MSVPRSEVPAAGLAAIVMGLTLCPFGYLAAGALAQFSPLLGFGMLPLLVASSGYLLYRFLALPAKAAPVNRIAEALCWLVIVVFLAIVSGISLQTVFERIGLTVSILMVTSVVCFPVALLRQTALQQRIARKVSGRTAAILLFVILLAGIGVVATYLNREPAFIG